MASVTGTGPVKLLSIDGGGVRGLSALVLLEQVMDLTNSKRRRLNLPPQEPWEMFDMIGGTSTGGLIAVMLGRLRMSIKDCKAAYMRLAEGAFTEESLLQRARNTVSVGPRFQTEPLEDAIKTIIGKDWETKLLKDEDTSCRVFVIAHLHRTNKKAILRSYRNFLLPKAELDHMLLWQACRATSAAVSFFEPIEVHGQKYSDGGLLYNNPVQLVHSEASGVFQGRDQHIISLGTGLCEVKKWNPSLFTIAKDLGALAAETDRTADDFYRLDGARAAKEGRYFRFDVPGLGDIGLEETKQLRDIEILTDNYLEDPEVSHKVDSCSQQLAEGVYTLVGAPVAPKASLNDASRSQVEVLEERFRKLKDS